MTGEERRLRGGGAFFGRRVGKPLSPLQSQALHEGLSRLGIRLDQPPPTDLRALFEAPVESVRLEIGFGGGEHLLSRATFEPDAGFIGVEPFVSSLAKVAASLAEQPLSNIRLYDDDATKLLDWLPDASIAGVDLLYPDPWPKKKHWKRRFVSPANLTRLARVVAPGGWFRFASDIETYVNWTLLAVRAHGGFVWQAADADHWHRPYAGWPGTRYEAKALREGRRPAYLTFLRL